MPIPAKLEHTNPIVPNSGLSLYIHVPFCKTKCPYCDFNTYQGIETLMIPYLKALTTEIELWGESLDHPQLNTIFFGGGTPSYLPQDSIGRILEATKASFGIQYEAEITIEANPGDLSENLCHKLLDAGVNRISFGVQSLDDNLLQMLGRRHNAEQAINAFNTAHQSGFTNINLDLIYGLPNQTIEQWQDSLNRLISLQPEHISLYCLTLEAGTPMESWVQQGKLPEPDPDLAADMYHYAEDQLEPAGYQHYEISNWSLPGCESEHNKAYWVNHPYLGVGPGAHSKLDQYRFWTIDSPRAYIDKVSQWAGSHPETIRKINEQTLRNIPTLGGNEFIDTNLNDSETLFLGLRILDGINLKEASAKTGTDLTAKYQQQIDELVDLGLLQQDNQQLKLTKKAYLIANQVFTRFLD